MDPFEIKLIGPQNPIAKDLVAQRSSRPTVLRRRIGVSRLGELNIEDAWVYP